MADIIIDNDKCDNCGDCADVCPMEVLILEDINGGKENEWRK